MNNIFHRDLGTRPDALPLRPSGNIVCGNACRLDWNTVCPHTINEEVYVMGNPPYLGARLQDETQKEDMEKTFNNKLSFSNLDYIASWFWNGAKYIKDNNAKYAFVSTNSISQGEQVSILWRNIFDLNLNIFFARTSFKWSNNAKNNAAVICTIIGVSNNSNEKKQIYNETTNECHQVDNINPYLSVGANIIVEKLHKSPFNMPHMDFGSMPNDGGNLILSEEEKENLVEEYPLSKQYIKRFMGSQEFIRDEFRYCLWLENEKDGREIPPIIARIEKCYQERNNSKRKATNKLAELSYKFGEIRYQPTDAIIVPAVSSERREYIPIGFVDKDTVISNSAFAIYDAELWLFGLLTSKMHNVWVRTVGGRLKTDYRYSATLCYNTFPFPKISNEQKDRLTTLAENILLVRENHTEMTLGEMYNPESMPMDLKVAHQALDIAVEQCYRTEPFTSDEERLEYLFKLYEKMTKKK